MISLRRKTVAPKTGAKSAAPQADDRWHPLTDPYPSLFSLRAHEPALKRGGIYAAWHLGVRPQWLAVGSADDLFTALTLVAAQLKSFQGNGGVFVGWSYPAADRREGIVQSLAARLRPALPVDIAVDTPQPIEYALPPGTAEPT